MSTTNVSPSKWDDLIYNLFYPSILGSIIFDYVDPLRFGDINRLWLAPIGFALVTDYWHMKNNIKVSEGSNWRFRIADVVVTILFMAAYYTVSHALTPTAPQNNLPGNFQGLFWNGICLMTSALSIVLLYDLFWFGRREAPRIFIGFVLLGVVAAVAYWTFGQMNPFYWVRYASTGLALLYLLYIFFPPTSLPAA